MYISRSFSCIRWVVLVYFSSNSDTSDFSVFLPWFHARWMNRLCKARRVTNLLRQTQDRRGNHCWGRFLSRMEKGILKMSWLFVPFVYVVPQKRDTENAMKNFKVLFNTPFAYENNFFSKWFPLFWPWGSRGDAFFIPFFLFFSFT